jgi:hypothetical protein
MAGVAGMFGGSLFSAMHGSLVTSSLIRETTETESQNYGYKFGQEEETYNIVAALTEAINFNYALCVVENIISIMFRFYRTNGRVALARPAPAIATPRC